MRALSDIDFSEHDIIRNTEAMRIVDHCCAWGYSFMEYAQNAFNKGYRMIEEDQYRARALLNEAMVYDQFVIG